jgi:hypothetical protein
MYVVGSRILLKWTLDKYWINVELIHMAEYIPLTYSLEQNYEFRLPEKAMIYFVL